ncbi:MAG: hypothetical protein ACRDX9_06005 [Acidimicrobiia bacterium]
MVAYGLFLWSETIGYLWIGAWIALIAVGLSWVRRNPENPES